VKKKYEATVCLHPGTQTPDSNFLHVCFLSFVLSASPVAPVRSVRHELSWVIGQHDQVIFTSVIEKNVLAYVNQEI
jgi:hypothetical protein